MLRRSSPSAAETQTPRDVSGWQGKVTEGEEIFGRLVAVRRAGLGLSQEDLAARIDSEPTEPTVTTGPPADSPGNRLGGGNGPGGTGPPGQGR
jgi:hypothetical protein